MSNGPLHVRYSLVAFCAIRYVFSDPVTFSPCFTSNWISFLLLIGRLYMH